MLAAGNADFRRMLNAAQQLKVENRTLREEASNDRETILRLEGQRTLLQYVDLVLQLRLHVLIAILLGKCTMTPRSRLRGVEHRSLSHGRSLSSASLSSTPPSTLRSRTGYQTNRRTVARVLARRLVLFPTRTPTQRTSSKAARRAVGVGSIPTRGSIKVVSLPQVPRSTSSTWTGRLSLRSRRRSCPTSSALYATLSRRLISCRRLGVRSKTMSVFGSIAPWRASLSAYVFATGNGR